MDTTLASAQHLTSHVSWPARVLASAPQLSSPILRLGLAAVLFPHGAQKLLGWFGGYGWSGTMGFLTGKIGVPTPVAALVILIESLGPVFLLLGLATRPVALGVIAVMLGAVATVHAPNGFFMNWSGAQAGEGFEYHLLVIGMALALLVSGGGSFSLDRRLAKAANARG
ncbi:MAG: DoxX family protein [Planctomycetes bacterium]|nr:DoxX family protein [Planctomycetota bacterium]